ncbi:MAG: phage head-tail connector protein [Alphaproteobacteria bacterium]|nr:phage head-tail connector protein [Alphaproteobacteria bacterium]
MSNLIYRLTETTPPASEPLTLAEIKTFLRIDHSNDDAIVTDLISSARQICESVTGRSLITRSYSLFLDFWPDASITEWWDGVREGADVVGKIRVLSLPKPPLLSVTLIKVYAADNTYAEFPSVSYYVDTAGIPGRVVLTQGASPPTPGRAANGIEIQFTAGYGATVQNVPALLRQGMKQVIAHLYEHRGDSTDQALFASGADVIFQSYRVMSLL